MNCLRVQSRIFTFHSSKALQWKLSQVDKKLEGLQSIVLDSYKRSEHSKFNRGLKLNRHLMILKVLISHTNLSISSCPPFQNEIEESESEKDIEFAYYANQQGQGNKSVTGTSHLFHSRERYEVKFVAPHIIDNYSTLISLIDPVGLVTFFTTIGLVAFFILILSLLSRLGEPIGFTSTAIVIIRPLLDQCEERSKALPSSKAYFRLILSTWLFYCLMITETYRSELISHLMKAPPRHWMKTFEELAQDTNRTLVNLGDRPGQNIYFVRVLLSDQLNTKSMKRRTNIASVIQRYNEMQNSPERFDSILAISKGLVAILGDSFVLEVFCKTYEKRYSGRFYDVSTEGITNPDFWSIKKGNHDKIIIQVLKWLRDYGILDFYLHQQDLIDEALYSYKIRQVFIDNPVAKQANYTADLEFESENVPKSLKVKHMVILMYIMALGCAAAFLLVCSEIYFFKWTTTKVETFSSSQLMSSVVQPKFF